MNNQDWSREVLKVLTLFDGGTAARGMDYFRRGRVVVRQIETGEGELKCLAEVQGEARYSVVISLMRDGRLNDRCSCPVQTKCKHIYATFRSIHSSLAVLQEFEKQKLQLLSQEVSKSKVEEMIRDMEMVFSEASGKKLTAVQKKRCERIVALFSRLRSSPRPELMASDLMALGIHPQENAWKEIPIWKAQKFPESVVDFWLGIVGYTRLLGATVDGAINLPFDTSRVKELVQWHIHQIKEKAYQDFLTRLTYNIPSKNSLPVRTSADIVLLLRKNRVDVEAMHSTQPTYQSVTNYDLDFLYDSYCADRLVIDRGAAIILEILSTLNMGGRVQLDLASELHCSLFRQILSTPECRSKVRNKSGQELQFDEEPLVWAIDKLPDSDGQEAQEVFSVKLKWLSGRPTPKWLYMFNGNPTYYCTDEIVAVGPLMQSKLFSAVSAVKIPIEWVRKPETFRAFQNMGFHMDPAVLEELALTSRSIQPRLKIKLWIESDPRYAMEVCLAQVYGQDPESGEDFLVYGRNGWNRVPAGQNQAETEAMVSPGLPDDLNIDDKYLRWMPTILRGLAPEYQEYNQAYLLPVVRNFPETFFQWLQTLPDAVVLEMDPNLTGIRNGTIRGNMAIRIEKTDTDWFDVELALDTGDYELTPEEKAILLKAPGNWVRLSSGAWKKLDVQFSDQDNEDLARIGLTPMEISAGPQKAHVLQLATPEAERWMNADQFAMVRERASRLKASVTPSIPDGVTATLRPYQTDGYHFLAYLSYNQFGGVLADDMGLGKTLQTLTWLRYIQLDKKVRNAPVLVVCPKSVMENWSQEVNHFVPEVTVHVWDPSTVWNFSARQKSFEIHVINYAQMRNLEQKLADIHWLAVILDEAQNIKNPTSQAWKAACSLKSNFRLALTGTPIENRLLDLWSIMEFAMPGILGNKSQFQEIYNSKKDPLARLRLSSRIRPFILRRTKDQVATDLPERVEEDILCILSGEQEKMYKAELKRAQQIMLKVNSSSEFNKVKFNVLTSLLRLRQICCHPKLYSGTSKGSSSKMEALIDHVEAILDQGNKVLVFSQFVEMLNILVKEATKRSWTHWLLTGQSENRGQLVKDFQSSEGAGIFFISLKAGGAGLNLTSAQYVILFDPWWNPAVENQAIDRTHRIGQTNRVVAYRLLAKNTVEEKIRNLQKSKSELAAEVLDESKFSESLTMEDIQYIFQDDVR